MSIVVIITAIFVEHIISVLGLAGVFFAVREYRERRQEHLLWFAIYFVGVAISFGAMYASHLLTAFGLTGAAHAASTVFWVVNTLDSALLVIIAFNVLLGRLTVRKRLALGVFLAVPVLVVLFGNYDLVDFGMLVYPNAIGPALAAAVGLRVLADGMFILMPRLRRRRGETVTMAHHELARAGFFGLLFTISATASIRVGSHELITIAMAFYVVRTFCLIVSSLAIGHTSERVRARPVSLLGRSLAFKMSSLTVLMFWLLAFFLLVTTSGYFTRSAIHSMEGSIRRDVHGLAKSYSGFKALFLEETTRLADQLTIIGQLKPDVGKTESVVRFLGAVPNQRLLRIVDSEGKIAFSSWSASEVGQEIGAVGVIRSALAGKRSVLAERDPSSGRWSIWAAVPVEIGIERAVVLATDVSAGIDFSDFQSGYSGNWSGAGFVSSDGDLIYGTGATPDRSTLKRLADFVGRRGAAGPLSVNDDRFSLEPVMDGNGTPDGFFYVSISGKQMSDEVIRIAGAVLAAVMLMLAALTLIIIMSALYMLRPIRGLRDAARSVENGNYDLRVRFDSSDELGDTARAFNRMSAAIADRTDRLRMALNEQHDFLAHMVHEMRTPLNIFRWTTEMMRFGDTGRLSKEQTELVEQLSQTTHRLQESVRKLDDVSKLDRGTMRFSSDRVAMEDVIDEAAGVLAVKIREKNINLHWNRPTASWPAVSGDRRRLLQVVVNLLDNAVKYTPRNGHIEIAGRTREAGEKDPTAYLELSIEDNGRGIPKDRHDRVFTRFFRFVDPTGEEIAGTGLGLFIAKELVQRHGGRIWFDSEEGRGTAFHFTLPIRPAAGGAPK